MQLVMQGLSNPKVLKNYYKAMDLVLKKNFIWFGRRTSLKVRYLRSNRRPGKPWAAQSDWSVARFLLTTWVGGRITSPRQVLSRGPVL